MDTFPSQGQARLEGRGEPVPLTERVLFIRPSALEMCIPRLPWGTMREEREWRMQKRRREQRGGWTADQVGSVWAPPPGGQEPASSDQETVWLVSGERRGGRRQMKDRGPQRLHEPLRWQSAAPAWGHPSQSPEPLGALCPPSKQRAQLCCCVDWAELHPPASVCSALILQICSLCVCHHTPSPQKSPRSHLQLIRDPMPSPRNRLSSLHL